MKYTFAREFIKNSLLIKIHNLIYIIQWKRLVIKYGRTVWQ